VIEKERNDSWKYGGRTVFGKAKPPVQQQLNYFNEALIAFSLNPDVLSVGSFVGKTTNSSIFGCIAVPF
jgi:hypothetical protein